MSLDVWLTLDEPIISAPMVYLREDGQIKGITVQEWYERHPDKAPIIVQEGESSVVYWGNITHNLNKMAEEAGIYHYLWRPDIMMISTAGELIEPLHIGLTLLQGQPDRFKAFNPENGWGDYDGLVRFVSDYLSACEKYPMAKVSVSR
jgi:hypothetical protein